MQQNITESLERNYMPYTAHVIMQRALPEIDGFKPSQRRVLYTMYKMGLQRGNRKKSQGIVGQTMFLHPHGDTSIYETLVRMSKDNESLILPYIDSKGNFGKVYSRDMQYASSRYTEAKLSNISKELFKDIEKNNVDMIDSYDGTLKEPRLLPVTFPNILVNSQSGTAVGMSSNFPSFNLREVIDFTIAYIKDNSVSVSEYIKAPDFSTGGNIIYDKNELNKIYNTGRGSFKIRANYVVTDNSIIFTEIPFTTNFESIIDKITILVKEGKIKEIVDIDDIYGINSKGIEITVKNNTDKERLIERLFLNTTLEDTFNCNLNLIVEGRPQLLGVRDIIEKWINFRVNTVRRSLEFEINKKQERRHLLTSLNRILLDIDKTISIIRNTRKNNEVIINLMNHFEIDEVQAEFVSDIKLRNLNEEYLINRTDEIKNLNLEIKELSDIINNENNILKLIIDELKDVKNIYGEDRKSNLINKSDISKIEDEKLTIENYNLKLIITDDGYLKKIPLTSLRGNFEIKLKDGDKIINEIELDNLSEILIFTDKHNVYKLKCYEIENSKPSDFGDFVPSLLNLKDEKVAYITGTKDFKEKLIIGFEDGRVSKIDMSAYKTIQNRNILKNAYANKKAIFFHKTNYDIDLFAIATDKKAVLLNTDKINAKSSRNTIGVMFMKLREGEVVNSYSIINDDSHEYYRLSNAGVGKYLKN